MLSASPSSVRRLITTSQQMGGALGLAVISGAAASVTSSLTTGYDVGMAVATGFTLVAVLLAVTVIRQPEPAVSQVAEPSRLGVVSGSERS